MRINFKKTINTESGITLYIALAVTGVLLLVMFAVINTSIKQLQFSSTANDSSKAFFAADSGTECALFWDVKSGSNPFATSTPLAPISCNGSSVNLTRSGATTTFSFTSDPCITVSVGKSYSNGSLKTRVESKGYNTCDFTNARRVERAIEVSY